MAFFRDPKQAKMWEHIDQAASTRMSSLDLSFLDITHLPEDLERLSGLRQLHLAHNRLDEMPKEILHLSNLDYLDLSHNGLQKIPTWINQLTNLKTLDLRHNKLKSLPMSLKECPSLEQIFLEGNDALRMPPEILEPTLINSSKILDYYFRIVRGHRPLNEAKLILVGRGGVGKTCLIKRLVDDTFNEKEKETPGIEIQPWPISLPDGASVRLHVWDFGGQEILHATHQFFMTERTLYLLVLSGREGNPTQDAEYWLQLIKSFGGDSRVLIALNKIKQHRFDINRGLLLEKYPLIRGFIYTDCEDATGITILQQTIIEQTSQIEHLKTSFPADWFDIKERLSTMEENFVSWEQYQEICRNLGEQDAQAQRQLAGFLHILGIALNYSDDLRLRDTHVLNPRWVTEGIYMLLRGGQQANRGGVLTRQDLATILEPNYYPDSHHDFLLRLMEKFQLSFRLPGHGERYLVPELLGESQPDIKTLLEAPGLDFRYQYEILPEGLLPRFIVQTHLHSEGNPRWRTGVVLERDGCRAVVRADERERHVDIHITGNEAHRRGLLAVIREKFDEQHRHLKGLSVDPRVPVPGERDITVSYQYLLMLEDEGEEWCRPEGASKKKRVADLLNGVDLPQSHRQPQLFISYSHKDRRSLDELLDHLKPLVRRGLSAWSDQQIMPGAQELDELSTALLASKVAVMLVSKDFLASNYVHEYQLGPLLGAAERGGVRLLWVLLSPCAWEETSLKGYHPVHPPDKPLSSFWRKTNRDAAWVEVCKKIKAALNDSF